MISVTELKEIGKELGLIYWRKNYKHYLSYSSPLFDNSDPEDKLLDSSIIEVNVDDKELYLYGTITSDKKYNNPNERYFYMVNVCGDSKGKCFLDYTKDQIKSHLVEFIDKIKNKLEQIKLDKIKEDFK